MTDEQFKYEWDDECNCDCSIIIYDSLIERLEEQLEYNNGFAKQDAQNALDFIIWQKEEHDKLNIELKVMRGVANSYKLELERKENELNALYKITDKQDDEISELYRKVASRENLEESFQKTTRNFDKRLEKTVEAERREAIKEFVEKLKAEIDIKATRTTQKALLETIIDKIVKEMTEEEK